MPTAVERMRALRERACRGIRRLTIDEGSGSGSDLSIGRCYSAAMPPVDCLFWLVVVGETAARCSWSAEERAGTI